MFKTIREQLVEEIEEIQEFSDYPLPYIDTKDATIEELKLYLSKNLKIAHESINNILHEDAGDRV